MRTLLEHAKGVRVLEVSAFQGAICFEKFKGVRVLQASAFQGDICTETFEVVSKV
jgi:hypothetical protein